MGVTFRKEGKPVTARLILTRRLVEEMISLGRDFRNPMNQLPASGLINGRSAVWV